MWRKEWDGRERGIRENESEGKKAVCGRVWYVRNALFTGLVLLCSSTRYSGNLYRRVVGDR